MSQVTHGNAKLFEMMGEEAPGMGQPKVSWARYQKNLKTY